MRLEGCHVGIAGLGLIGGSMAAALARGGREVSGWDIDRTVTDRALERRIITRSAPTLEALAAGTDLLVLAAPIRRLVPLGRQAASAGNRPRALFDVGSVRAGVSDELGSLWGDRHLGFHPMAGRERGGIDNADAALFRGATVALVPSGATSPETLQLGKELAAALDARWLQVSPERHDRITACVSHLPMLVASALALTAGGELEALPELPALAGGGFRDTTRVASGPSWLAADVWERNGEAIGAVLRELTGLLERMRRASPQEIEALCDRAGAIRAAILAGVEPDSEDGGSGGVPNSLQADQRREQE
ncbi:MAG: prephenate dehydrogenase/arogenate dehydrogenase family protein [Synergistales bacterium]|nr:prephenate dehydrogenase/arogenate dehydrogenase family protein [Synergistales bacterium]